MATFEDDGHIDASDTFFLGDADLANSETVTMAWLIATATIAPGDAALLAFIDPVGPGHVPTSDYVTDVLFDATIVFTGGWETVYWTAGTSENPSTFDITVSPTSAGAGDVITLSMAGTYSFLSTNEDIAGTLTFDMILDLVATAHVVPDPALSGLAALGIGGAGAWLRRRPRRSDTHRSTRPRSRRPSRSLGREETCCPAPPRRDHRT